MEICLIYIKQAKRKITSELLLSIEVPWLLRFSCVPYTLEYHWKERNTSRNLGLLPLPILFKSSLEQAKPTSGPCNESMRKTYYWESARNVAPTSLWRNIYSLWWGWPHPLCYWVVRTCTGFLMNCIVCKQGVWNWPNRHEKGVESSTMVTTGSTTMAGPLSSMYATAWTHLFWTWPSWWIQTDKTTIWPNGMSKKSVRGKKNIKGTFTLKTCDKSAAKSAPLAQYEHTLNL